MKPRIVCTPELSVPRPLYTIAKEIVANWPNMNYAARPYVMAMLDLDKISDKYIHDTGQDVVLRFLVNAQTWKGSVAREVKAELKRMLRDNGYPIR